MHINEACRQFLSFCEHAKNLSSNTLRAYDKDLRNLIEFCEYCGNSGSVMLVEQLDRDFFKRFIVQLNQQELSKATIKRKVACIKAMFRWMELEEYIEINPFHKLDLKLRLPRRLPRNIPKKELSAMLLKAKSEVGLKHSQKFSFSTLSKVVKSKRDLNRLTTLVIVELLIATGLRVSEVVSIQLEHIFWNERKIRILGKGQRERYVYLPSNTLFELVFSYQKLRNITAASHQYLLVNSRGKAASTQFARKLVREIAAKSGISRKITPHMYRHSAACQLLEAGVDIRFVQRLLGHHSISTTEIYTYVNDSVLQEQICRADVRGGLGR